MKALLSFLSGKKTIIIGLVTVLYAAGVQFKWWPHDATIDLLLGGGAAITLRLAITKLCQQLNDTIDVVGTKLLMVSLLPALFFAGCATTGQTSSDNFAKYEVAIRPGVALASRAVLLLAVQPQDRADIAGDMYAVSAVVKALSFGSTPTPAQLQASISLATPKAKEWTDLAATIFSLS